MEEVSKTSGSDKMIIEAFAKLNQTALGIAVGTVCGFGVFLVTVLLLIKGGDVVGPNLSLLGQFFIGYTVSVKGAFIGLAYGLVAGFIIGWLIGFFRNSLLSIYLLTLKTRANLTSSLDSID